MFNQTSSAPPNRVGLSNEAIAQGLERIAKRLVQDGRPMPRRQSVLRAASEIRATTKPVSAIIDERGVEGVHLLGLNYELSGIVTDWVKTGRLPWLERLEAARQEELARLPGIGPRLAQQLRDLIGVSDLDDLAEAVREGRLKEICGLGPKRMQAVAGVLAGRAHHPRQNDEPRQLSLLAVG